MGERHSVPSKKKIDMYNFLRLEFCHAKRAQETLLFYPSFQQKKKHLIESYLVPLPHCLST